MSSDSKRVIQFPAGLANSGYAEGTTAKDGKKGKVISFDPRVHDIDAFTNLNPEGTERRRQEALKRDRLYDKKFAKAQALSLEKDKAQMQKKRRSSNAKTLAELALLLALLAATVRGCVYVNDKYPEEYPKKSGAEGSSFAELGETKDGTLMEQGLSEEEKTVAEALANGRISWDYVHKTGGRQ